MIHLPEAAGRALRLAPVALWWVLVVLVLAIGSILWQQELWPYTPAALPLSRFVVQLCLLLLPLLGFWWLWRLAAGISHRGWRWLGYAVVLAFTGLAVLLVVLGCAVWVWWG
ncbi:hypothetical protein LRS06_13950 [Hymenobacter sp. J193]|uniref:hypothetical protein n=1 Tax=Hymenobacter sp. J193 TaxID=2898429 RepID=UPI002151A9C3|nr:hypothetical protein [Hymenobacter sp. J193]MCR5888847.1 hypothetical protein [Hymenobacter sp. J193]